LTVLATDALGIEVRCRGVGKRRLERQLAWEDGTYPLKDTVRETHRKTAQPPTNPCPDTVTTIDRLKVANHLESQQSHSTQ